MNGEFKRRHDIDKIKSTLQRRSFYCSYYFFELRMYFLNSIFYSFAEVSRRTKSIEIIEIASLAPLNVRHKISYKMRGKLEETAGSAIYVHSKKLEKRVCHSSRFQLDFFPYLSRRRNYRLLRLEHVQFVLLIFFFTKWKCIKINYNYERHLYWFYYKSDINFR